MCRAQQANAIITRRRGPEVVALDFTRLMGPKKGRYFHLRRRGVVKAFTEYLMVLYYR